MEEKFEQITEKMKDLSEEEKQKKMEEARKICKKYCGTCPSYVGTGETELLFCATGKSKIIKEERGCVCPGCPVQKSMALRWDYYCMKGSGKEQAGIK